MDYQQKSASELAQFFLNNKKITQVYYPGLPEHEGRDIHFSNMT